MRDIHNKINFTSNNNYWVLQLSVFLPFAYLLKLFHSCEIKTVWTFPRGPKEVKEFSSTGFATHPRWDIWPRVDLFLYSHAFTHINLHNNNNNTPVVLLFRLQSKAQNHATQNTISFQSLNTEKHVDLSGTHRSLQGHCFKAVLQIPMLMFIIF